MVSYYRQGRPDERNCIHKQRSLAVTNLYEAIADPRTLYECGGESATVSSWASARDVRCCCQEWSSQCCHNAKTSAHPPAYGPIHADRRSRSAGLISPYRRQNLEINHEVTMKFRVHAMSGLCSQRACQLNVEASPPHAPLVVLGAALSSRAHAVA